MQFKANESVNRWNVCFYENDWKVVRFCCITKRKTKEHLSNFSEKKSACILKNSRKNQEHMHRLYVFVCVVEQWSTQDMHFNWQTARVSEWVQRREKKWYRFNTTRIFKGDMGFQIRKHNIICNTSGIKMYTALTNTKTPAICYLENCCTRSIASVYICLSSKMVFAQRSAYPFYALCAWVW